jgi:hypothetical protein
LKKDAFIMSDLAHLRNPALELPALIADAGERAAWRFLEFFTVNIRNKKLVLPMRCLTGWWSATLSKSTRRMRCAGRNIHSAKVKRPCSPALRSQKNATGR